MLKAFGDGAEYDWALQMQADEEEDALEGDIQIKDIFEPSQLEEKMLTEYDDEIRRTDIPERYQISRKSFAPRDLSADDLQLLLDEEATWITSLLAPKKKLDSGKTSERALPRHMYDDLQKAVRNALDFINRDNYEIPFIFQQRRDYLIAQEIVDVTPSPENPDGQKKNAIRLLEQRELWEIFELDLKFRALVEKRDALKTSYASLKELANVSDPVFEELLPRCVTTEEIQDIQDYLQFQYGAELRDLNTVENGTNGQHKRAKSTRGPWEKVRASQIYNLVRAFGLTADAFAQNGLDGSRKHYTEDPSDRPDDMADSLIDAPSFSTGAEVLRAGKNMFAEELSLSPRMRKLVRQNFYQSGLIDCYRTEKGARQITEDHRYYEFKYLRGQDFLAISRQPEKYLRMLKAEEEGLIEVRIRVGSYQNWKEGLYKYIESDNFSEVADAWNALRREALDLALTKLQALIAKGVKEALKAECENQLASTCGERYYEKLDQAPYKPKGMDLGTPPRVLTLSNGQGNAARDAICWAFLEDDGRVLENGKFVDLRLGNSEKYIPDGKDVQTFVELVQRRKPDVIGVSGWSVETRRLYKDLQDLVDKHDIRGGEYEDEDGNETSERLEVVLVNDEVARLYHTSPRAEKEYPTLAPLTRYCIALAKYLQSPMLEYAALDKDIISISFDPNQDLLPKEKLMKHIETAMVDMVNLVGLDINEALADSYTANLLPYICGLGPRKAQQLLKVVDRQGGTVTTREELVGNPETNTLPAVSPNVFVNCASFLRIDGDWNDPEADYLDCTRVHPEDYEIARKMAADAMEIDEEDVKAERDENGPGAIVKRLIREEQQDKVNDLILEDYAAQLENLFKSKKRATLETIRAELNSPFEELRRNFSMLGTDEIFTMLTGETRESLTENMIVPVHIKRTFPDHIEVRLDCGIEGGVSESEYPEGVGGERGIEPRQAFAIHQIVRAKITFIDRKKLSAQLTMREDALRRPYRRHVDTGPGEWDDGQEEADKKAEQKAKESVSGRQQRVINHPLFKPFNTTQAEEYLGSQSRGDAVVRPSAKGLDHLVVTWKVSDNVYQHIDVLELDKENEFSLGRTLKVGGKYTYSDLDELIVLHVKAMAKKVDEMMNDDKYHHTPRADVGKHNRISRCWVSFILTINPRTLAYDLY